MARATARIPTFGAFLAFLAIAYAVGYGAGLALTGSTLGAFVAAFVTACISLVLLLLIVPLRRIHPSDRTPIP